MINFDIQRTNCVIFVKKNTQNMKIIRNIFIMAGLLFLFNTAGAQERIGGVLEVDRMVHNFGNILLGSRPVSCTFTVRNISDKPLVIYNVASHADALMSSGQKNLCCRERQGQLELHIQMMKVPTLLTRP